MTLRYRLSKTIALFLALVFLSMSGCLIMQYMAAPSQESHSCHNEDRNDSSSQTQMERCCDPGILKSSQKVSPQFAICAVVPDFQFRLQNATSASEAFASELFIPLASSRRLAELSLLRI